MSRWPPICFRNLSLKFEIEKVAKNMWENKCNRLEISPKKSWFLENLQISIFVNLEIKARKKRTTFENKIQYFCQIIQRNNNIKNIVHKRLNRYTLRYILFSRLLFANNFKLYFSLKKMKNMFLINNVFEVWNYFQPR